MFTNFSESFSPRPLYFDRAVNCQPSYRAGPLIAEARTPQPSFHYSFPYFFAPDTPIFTKNYYENDKNLNFFNFKKFFDELRKNVYLTK